MYHNVILPRHAEIAGQVAVVFSACWVAIWRGILESRPVFLVLGALLSLGFSTVFSAFACCSGSSSYWVSGWCEIVESRSVMSLLLLTVSAMFSVLHCSFSYRISDWVAEWVAGWVAGWVEWWAGGVGIGLAWDRGEQVCYVTAAADCLRNVLRTALLLLL